ncbi:MAG: hypothetical protein KDA58_04560, partial [Planctomycetaceae bacterium]|nr:hypothetical protein [Planctomycetaceae bacterium]
IQRSGMGAVGQSAYSGLTIWSSILAAFLATRLEGDSVGERSTGALQLLQLSGVTPRQCLLVRWGQMTIGFLSVWLIRLPFVLLAVTLGGLDWLNVVIQEIALVGLFCVLGSFALTIAIQAASRSIVWQGAIGIVVLVESLVAIPVFTLLIIEQSYGLSFPVSLQQAAEFLGTFRGSSILSANLTNSLEWEMALRPLLLYSLLVGIASWMYLVTIYLPGDELEGQPDTGTGSAVKRTESAAVLKRPPRAIWADALAWQALVYHSPFWAYLPFKVFSYIIALICLPVAFAYDFADQALILIAVAAGTMLLLTLNKPADCLQREIKEETLPWLLIAGFDVVDLINGWRRGSNWVVWPDVLLWGVVVVVSGARHPETLPILLAIGAWIFTAWPFMALSPLVPFSLKGGLAGFAIVGIMVVLVVFAIIIGATISPWAVFPLALPPWIVYNYLLKTRLLPYWAQVKLEAS